VNDQGATSLDMCLFSNISEGQVCAIAGSMLAMLDKNLEMVAFKGLDPNLTGALLPPLCMRYSVYVQCERIESSVHVHLLLCKELQ
jgi:hypothetical protein